MGSSHSSSNNLTQSPNSADMRSTPDISLSRTSKEQQQPAESDGERITQQTRQQSHRRRRRLALSQLTSYQDVDKYCRREKTAYDKCFTKWYSGSFLRAQVTEEGESSREFCDDLFEIYRTCYLGAIAQVRKATGAKQAKEGSMVAEFEEEEQYDKHEDSRKHK